jgi:hypothetical protein
MAMAMAIRRCCGMLCLKFANQLDRIPILLARAKKYLDSANGKRLVFACVKWEDFYVY